MKVTCIGCNVEFDCQSDEVHCWCMDISPRDFTLMSIPGTCICKSCLMKQPPVVEKVRND